MRAWIALCLLAVTLPAGSAPNMLLNGDFEKGATGWSLPGEAQIVSEGAREGRNCLRISTSFLAGR